MVRVFSVRSVSAVVIAALVGSLGALLTPIAPTAFAQPQAETALPGVLAKGDRLPRRSAEAACSVQSWPSLDQKCLFDLRRSADDVREVRVVSLIRHASPKK